MKLVKKDEGKKDCPPEEEATREYWVRVTRDWSLLHFKCCDLNAAAVPRNVFHILPHRCFEMPLSSADLLQKRQAQITHSHSSRPGVYGKEKWNFSLSVHRFSICAKYY